MHRKRFIQSIIGTIILLLTKACGLRENKPAKKINQDSTQTISPPIEEGNPIFYTEKDPEYNLLKSGFNKRILASPAIIALCKNTTDVAASVRYAIKNKLPVSIKSGGHSFEGFSINEKGIVVNCSNINHIEWNSDGTVSIGPGCLIKDLYPELLSRNKLIPAGSCGGVGIGGLTLGGGYGLFSRKHGLTCDSLMEVTMVDGTGNIINSSNDKELLWGCKGGGNGNFGIVTNMKFKVHEVKNNMHCIRFTSRNINPEDTKIIYKKWFELTENLPIECFSAIVYNGRSIYILLTNLADNNYAIQPVIDELSRVTSKVSIGKPLPLISAVKQFYGIQHPVYFKNCSVGLYDGFEDIDSFLEPVIKKIHLHKELIFQINTLGGNILNSSAEVSSSFPHRNKKWLSELQCYWNKEEATENKLSIFREIKKLFDKSQESQYCNYPDLQLDNWQNAYYGKNLERLKIIKHKFDPDNVFQHGQSI